MSRRRMGMPPIVMLPNQPRRLGACMRGMSAGLLLAALLGAPGKAVETAEEILTLILKLIPGRVCVDAGGCCSSHRCDVEC